MSFVESAVPSTPLTRFIASLFHTITGWRCVGKVPDLDKYVIAAAPHTSNWDFIYMLFFSISLGLPVSWMAKASLFKPPLGWVMRPLGGVPIDRSSKHNIVEQAVHAFERRESLVLGITPEATRSYRPHWKSGFYHIAYQADVPLVLAYIDYEKKIVGVGPTIHLTGDIETDMDKLRAFFADKTPKHPDDFGPIRLRSELTEPPDSD